MNTSESILRELCNVPEKVKNVCLWVRRHYPDIRVYKIKEKVMRDLS